MAPMPFYADPNRFSTPVWQTDPTQGWPQGQFIQQIPAVSSQPPLEGYPQQYSNGIYQATYQQPPGFETNAFYTGAVQVLARPPSAPNQTQLSTRPNGSYSHTPSPVPAQQQPNNQRTNISGQYQQEYAASSQSYAAPATTPTGSVDSSQAGAISRPNSVNSAANVPSNSQGFQAQHGGSFTPISSSTFSPVSNTATSFASSSMTANSGNAMPGYPPVNSHPQLVSHNYSGGYPGSDLSGQNAATDSSHSEDAQQWSAVWDQNGTQPACNNESAKLNQSEMQQYASSGPPPQNQQQAKSEEMQYGAQQGEKSDDGGLPQSHMQSNAELQFSQADRINLNSRLKTMILNKQQQQQMENKMESQKIEHNNSTGHFLSYSHHRHPSNIGDGGGFSINQLRHNMAFHKYNKESFSSAFQKNQSVSNSENNKQAFLQNKNHQIKENSYKLQHNFHQNGLNVDQQDKNKLENLRRSEEFERIPQFQGNNFNSYYENVKKEPPETPHKSNNAPKSSPLQSSPLDPEKYKNTIGLEIPPCNCLPPNQIAPEPGSYYTHLGCANSLVSLRKDLEYRTGVNGKGLRIEKILYTGKEGKTPQGCPIAKWIIRRANYDEKYLIIVKQRPGHFCQSAIIVVCIVAWDGVLQSNADAIYSMLCEKLNKFGLPTNRRCATNEPRTCACQGLDSETCGASFSFGCSWSMYYNGCKYARSKNCVRKFRLSVNTEEQEVEEQLQSLATHLTPIYKALAPQSFQNQCEHEQIASDCRLGLRPGRPFSGVTACLDFCAHSHKDSHNMTNGCTVVVTLTKHRGISKPNDEQLHVLPLYVVDSTDEFGSREDQQEKIINGSIEVLHKYECEVRVRNIPQATCRRKKRKGDLQEKPNGVVTKKDNATPPKPSPSNCNSPQRTPPKQLQSNRVSSTVVQQSDYPRLGYDYDNSLYYNPTSNWRSSTVQGQPSNVYYDNAQLLSDASYRKTFESPSNAVLDQNRPHTALNFTYPNLQDNTVSRKITATTPTNQYYRQFSTNASQFHQNTALNAKAIATEYKHSQLDSSAYGKPHNNIYRRDDKTNGTKNGDLDFICPGSIKKEIKKENFDTKYDDISSSVNWNLNSIYSKTPVLPSFQCLKNNNLQNYYSRSYNNPFSPERKLGPSQVFVQNPFDDSLVHSPGNIENSDLYYADYNPCSTLPSPNWLASNTATPNWIRANFGWSPPEPIRTEMLGQVTDFIDNNHCFRDSQVGGVAIALGHGSVLFECAKHELHATTALKSPNRKSPTRISLVFYQHRNLNKPKHGWEEHEEKMRLRRLDSESLDAITSVKSLTVGSKFRLTWSTDMTVKGVAAKAPTLTTMSVTTVFPMYPCVVTGPYQEGVKGA